MYVGMIVLYVANSLILGSAWALVLSVIVAAMVIWRTAREDRTLHDELAGYEDYPRARAIDSFPDYGK